MNGRRDFFILSLRLRVLTAPLSVGRLTRSKFKDKEHPKEKEKKSEGKKMINKGKGKKSVKSTKSKK